MTLATRQIRFAPLRIDGAGAPAIAAGTYIIEPTAAYDDGAGRVEALAFQLDIDGVAVTVDLPVTPVTTDWVIKASGTFPSGGSTRRTTEYVEIPAGDYAVVLEFENLPRLNPVDAVPLTPEVIAAWLVVKAAAEAASAAAAASATAAAASATSSAGAASAAAEDVRTEIEADVTAFIAPVVLTAVAGKAPVTAKYLTTPTGGDDTALIQAVIDSAGADDMVRIVGTYVIAGTVVIKGNFDGSGAVFNYSGSGLAVQVGSTSAVTFRKRILLPRIVCTNKPTTGWTAGTVGVKFVNMNSCDAIHVSHVENFEIGMLVYGQGTGISYCTFLIGHLSNNKINQQLAADTTGWSNQNTFIGGRYGHNSAEGLNVTGTRQVDMATGLGSPPNNNLWLNASFEYGTAEWHINAAGSNNVWLNCRYEVVGGARVQWQADAINNQLLYGYKSDAIVETYITGATRNHILTPVKWKVSASVGVQLENGSSAANPALVVLPPGAITAGTDPATGYSGKLTANAWTGKRTADAFDRIQLDMQNARVYLGNGAAAPVAYWQGNSLAMILGGGVSLTFQTDNAADVGSTTARPRYVRAGSALQTGNDITANRPSAVTAGAGATFYDTTISRMLFSNGATWDDPLAAAASVAAPGLSGMVGWGFDPSLCSQGIVLAAGTLTGSRLWIPSACSITNLLINVNLAPTALTAGQNFAALYTTAGVLLGVTADQSTAWATTGPKTMALAGGAVAVSAGFYDIAFWSNGTTPPRLWSAANTSVTNSGTSATVSRYWTADTGLTTTAPTPRTTKAANTTSYWVGAS